MNCDSQIKYEDKKTKKYPVMTYMYRYVNKIKK